MQLDQRLQDHKVFVAPVLNGTGIATKNVLAMAHGIPLVTTRIGSLAKGYSELELMQLGKEGALELLLTLYGVMLFVQPPPLTAEAADRMLAIARRENAPLRRLTARQQMHHRSTRQAVVEVLAPFGRRRLGGFELFGIERLDRGEQDQRGEWKPLPGHDHDDRR